MIDIVQNKIERAFLVGLKTRFQTNEIVHEHINELEELVRTAGGEVIDKIIQERSRPDGAYYIGKGKAEEIALRVEEEEIDLVIFDDDLSPGQARNLELLFNKKVLDRSGLILDIFASHAKTKTARTQVELAQLQYMLPRLTRAWTHLSKQYGGIGTKGPGETQIETDRRIIRDRIAFLQNKLKEIENDREQQTKLRKDIVRLTLVGYTNAGKSTLFNLLTNAGVQAEDKLFATLDSTTRTFQLQKQIEVLLSDTVGFIRKLPHHLVASFKSTLSEVVEADIILHVIDIANPSYEDHRAVVEQTLDDIGCKNKTIIKVFNKVDSIPDRSAIQYLINKYPDAAVISAEKGMNIGRLIELIASIVENDYEIVDKILAPDKTYLIRKINQFAELLEENYDDKGNAQVQIKIKKSQRIKLDQLFRS